MRLTTELSNLLAEILKKYEIDLRSEDWIDGITISESSVHEKLIDALSSELCETGLRDDDEPNERGLQIESLIDWVNRRDQASRTQ